MDGNKKQSDIVQRLNSAAAETEALKDELRQAKNQDYDSIAGSLAANLAANYQLIMDEAEQEIADEYKTTGTLTSARVCEINRGIDGYALSVQDVMTLLKELQDGE